MGKTKQLIKLLFLNALFLLIVACNQDEPADTSSAVDPEPTNTATSLDDVEGTTNSSRDLNFITIATDAPSRFQDFEDIDELGNVVGFDPDLMANLAARAGFEYEFVVTSYSGLLDSIGNGEFDTAMSALIIPDQVTSGLVYTIPYLEVGQVLVVRANESEIQNYRDIGAGIPVGVQRFSSGEQTARTVIGLTEPDMQLYDGTPQALQALIDLEIDGVILDSDDAEHFTNSYPQQLKIAGVPGKEAWITEKAYGIVLSQENESLLEALNDSIARAREDGTIENITRTWLVPQGTINAGESLVGTAADELVVGVVGKLTELDTASRNPDLISWEVKRNTMSGLLMYDSENRLVPILAEDFPIISEDKLEYSFSIRPGLTFPDGSELSADDIRFSIMRAAGLGNFQVNRYLKDANEDNFADEDAVQVLDPLTVKFVLQEPTSYFPSVLATPPFYIIGEACYAANPEPGIACGGIGPYTITEWELDEHMRLQANPQWPATTPAFENVQLRFYDDPDRMLRSLENSAIDVAWTGISPNAQLELRQSPQFNYWEGPSVFKSYLVIEQSESPWQNARLREAIAHTIDRQALADNVFEGSRKPLFSPVPDDTPGHVPTEPQRDLEVARSILTAAGYSASNKLEMTIWYVSDGRYTVLEEQYATALKEQIEELGLIEVTLEGAPWQVFRPESLNCNYPAFLLGWPSSGQPASFLDAMSWMEYFITNTDSVCSNFESDAMTELYEEAMQETDESIRLNLYRQIQELWAREFPTLDLTQEPRVAVSLPNVQDVTIDAMGLMHYDKLTKTGE